jgi:hypothetical protein
MPWGGLGVEVIVCEDVKVVLSITKASEENVMVIQQLFRSCNEVLGE